MNLDFESERKIINTAYFINNYIMVPFADNKFSALNGAVWSGGSFIYVPKGVKVEKHDIEDENFKNKIGNIINKTLNKNFSK